VEESGMAGMKEDLTQWAVEGNSEHEKLRGVQNNLFWLLTRQLNSQILLINVL